jgi:hypothetical protein
MDPNLKDRIMGLLLFFVFLTGIFWTMYYMLWIMLEIYLKIGGAVQ